MFWENGRAVDPDRLETLAHYAQLIAQKNEKLNLISRRDQNSIVENHIFISSLLMDYIPEKSSRFLDIGTGGGFPGIPLGILRPELNGMLVDSTQKKINAIEEFIEKLNLFNLNAVSARVESPEFIETYKDSFDLIVSRAVASLIVLVRYSLPLIQNKAALVAIKGGKLEEEINEAQKKYKTHIKKTISFDLKYKPNNTRNEKEKKLIIIELTK